MKDHLAGSIAVIELLNHLISGYSQKPLEEFFRGLRREVSEDQEALRKLLHDLDAADSPVRNTAAFFSEKLDRVKLLLEDPTGGQLALLENLEALALGIEGKRALWRALGAVAEEVPPLLRNVDLKRLEERADEQRKRIEPHRIEAARDAFALVRW
jgi:hypothetical protein